MVPQTYTSACETKGCVRHAMMDSAFLARSALSLFYWTIRRGSLPKLASSIVPVVSAGLVLSSMHGRGTCWRALPFGS